MKKTLTCPKCGNGFVWHLAEMRERGEQDSLQPIRVLYFRPDEEAGRLEMYVCERCGYTELYTKGHEDFKENPALGLRLLSKDGAKPGGGQ